MRAAWLAFPPDMGQKSGVSLGHLEVISLDRDGVEHSRNEPLAPLSSPPLCKLNTDLQLSYGDRRHRNIVVVVDRPGKRIASALGIDQNRGVEDQSRQGSVTGSMLSRSCRSSSIQASSGG